MEDRTEDYLKSVKKMLIFVFLLLLAICLLFLIMWYSQIYGYFIAGIFFWIVLLINMMILFYIIYINRKIKKIKK